MLAPLLVGIYHFVLEAELMDWNCRAFMGRLSEGALGMAFMRIVCANFYCWDPFAKIEQIDKSQNIKRTKDLTEWYELERFSQRQGGKMKMGGILGEVT